MHQSNSPFNIKNVLPANNQVRSSPSHLNSNISGNIRLESNFTRVNQPAPNVSAFAAPTISPIRRVEQSVDLASNTDTTEIGAASQGVTALTENKSAIGRLDDLIEDFSKPVGNPAQ